MGRRLHRQLALLNPPVGAQHLYPACPEAHGEPRSAVPNRPNRVRSPELAVIPPVKIPL
jgi:hypothetical protein